MKLKKKGLPNILKTKKPFVVGLIVGLILITSLVLFLTRSSQEKHITISGECGLMMGKVFNRIQTEEDCRVQCRNECFAIEHKLLMGILIQHNDTKCNSCECYCTK